MHGCAERDARIEPGRPTWAGLLRPPGAGPTDSQVVDEHGMALRGLLLRHLLPGNLAGTPDIVTFLADEISPETALNLMDPHRPSQ